MMLLNINALVAIGTFLLIANCACFAQGSEQVKISNGIPGVSVTKEFDLLRPWNKKRFFSFESTESLFNSFTVIEDTINKSINVSYSGHQLFISLPANEYLWLESAFRHSVLQIGKHASSHGSEGHVYIAYVHSLEFYLEKPVFYNHDIDFFINCFVQEIKCTNNPMSIDNQQQLINLFKALP